MIEKPPIVIINAVFIPDNNVGNNDIVIDHNCASCVPAKTFVLYPAHLAKKSCSFPLDFMVSIIIKPFIAVPYSLPASC